MVGREEPVFGCPDLTSTADINADGRGQTVTAPYDYRHRPVTCLTCAFAAVMRMG